MVFVNNKKYACATCIKGHRSSTCGHTNRPLFEIKRKGRPQTQCEHCRRLRKTRQVHVRCDCASLEDVPDGQRVRDGEVSMYPNGVADILNSISVPAQYPTPARLENLLNSCDCGRGGACYCCTPRQSAKRSKTSRAQAAQSRRRGSSGSPTSSTLSASASLGPASSASGGCCGDQDMADSAVGGLFSAATGSSPESGGNCTESSGAGCGADCSCRGSDGSCGKACCRASQSGGDGATPRAWPSASGSGSRRGREQSVTGEAAMYAEMALADLARGGSGRPSVSLGGSMSATPTMLQQGSSTPTPSASLPGHLPPPYAPYVPTSHPSSSDPTANPTAQLLADTAALTRCACGWSCSCPGCAEHNPTSAQAAYDLCPTMCSTCFDCAAGPAYSLGSFLPSTGTPGGANIPSPAPEESVDAFLARQALAYGLPPAPPSRAGAAHLSHYSGSTFVLPYAALGGNAHAARASGVARIRKLCCAGQCACEEGECRCAEGCGGGRGEGGCLDQGHNHAASSSASSAGGAKTGGGSCCSSKPARTSVSSSAPQHQSQPPPLAYPWSLPTSFLPSLPSHSGAYNAHALSFSPISPVSPISASRTVHPHQQQQHPHAHGHVPFGAFQQALGTAGMHPPTQGSQGWGS